MTPAEALHRRFFPETAVGGFSHLDGMVDFYSRIAALVRPDWRVLDFGAGRGAQLLECGSPYVRELMMLKGRVAHVEGCDVDQAVLGNPTLDHATLIRPGEPLPYADASFDLVLSRYVFEHVEDPPAVAAELARVTRPGGWIAAITANRWGYVALASSLVPNRRHARLLRTVQPGRREEDVFPTRYRMNTRRALARLFAPYGEVYSYTQSAEPAYHFGSPLLYRLAMLAHKLLPAALQTGLTLFVHRHPAAAAPAADRPLSQGA